LVTQHNGGGPLAVAEKKHYSAGDFYILQNMKLNQLLV